MEEMNLESDSLGVMGLVRSVRSRHVLKERILASSLIKVALLLPAEAQRVFYDANWDRMAFVAGQSSGSLG